MNVGLTVGLILFAAAAYLFSSIKILPPGQRAVIFRLGRVQLQPKGPGIVMILVPFDRLVRVSMDEQQVEVPAQEVVTHDELTRRVAAVVKFRVLDPVRALTEVSDYRQQISQLASGAIRTKCSEVNGDEVGEKAASIGVAAQKAMDDLTGRWGVRVLQVNVSEA